MKQNFTEEYVEINGISQYFLHYAGQAAGPVVLCIHGGPGSAESIFAYEVEKAWNGNYSIVYYDQRGAGKTFARNKSAPVSMELLQQDLLETILYLRKKYNKVKIILLAHSFGTALGILLTRQHPEYVLCYIGMSQVVDWIENESVGYQKLLAAMAKTPNAKDQQQIEKLGKYPDARFEATTLKKAIAIRRMQLKYKLASGPSPMAVLRLVFKSPVFRLSDLGWMFAGGRVNEKVIGQLWEFSLHAQDAHYDTPIYFIMGENDSTTPIEIAAGYLESVQAPDKKLYRIPNAGHMTMFDNLEGYQQAVGEIIEKVS